MGNELDKIMLSNDYITELRMNHPWVERAISDPQRWKVNESLRTMHDIDPDLGWIVYPSIRKDEKGLLMEYPREEAMAMAIENKDYISVPSEPAGQYLSSGLSNWLGRHRKHK